MDAKAWMMIGGRHDHRIDLALDLSSIFRKSVKIFAFGYFLKVRPAWFASTSQRATMFSLLSCSRSDAPWLPMPIPAILSFSLGGVFPLRPSTWLGTIMKAVEVMAALRRKVLRLGPECESDVLGWRTLFSPSPRPSPLGRGRAIWRRNLESRFGDLSSGVEECSPSLGRGPG